MIKQKAHKPKKCKGCGEIFTPARPMQSVCSPRCGLKIAKTAAERKAAKAKRDEAKQKRLAALERKRKDRAWLEANKSIGELTKEAQVQVNAYVRLRDRIAGHPCISCGRTLQWDGDNVDAGHYRSRGSSAHLRFDLRNIHAQCKHCNRHQGGNYSNYRIGLINRIGLSAVEELEADQEPRNYRHDDLREIRDTYRAKVRELKKSTNGS